MRPPKTCPSCGGVQLSYLGFGTQRAESELLSLVENITVLRMDADTTTGKNSYDRMIESFRMGEHDVLLGTQMVTKGHDFPSVTLSGVLLADSSLYMSDFRAAEQTFSLLTQVIGRAGRAKNPGCAVIQTFCPNHEVIRLAAKQDYLGFYTQEIAYRKGAMFPPFCDLVRVMLSSKEEKLLYESAEDVKAWFLNALQSDKVKSRYEVYGPLEMQTFKVGGKFRMKFILKCRWNEECRAVMRSLHQYFSKKYNMRVSFSVDANPMGE